MTGTGNAVSHEQEGETALHGRLYLEHIIGVSAAESQTFGC